MYYYSAYIPVSGLDRLLVLPRTSITTVYAHCKLLGTYKPTNRVGVDGKTV